MQLEPKDANKLEPNAHSIPPSTICSQPWWRGVEYSAISSVVLAESASKSPSMEHPNGDVGTKAVQSQPKGRLNEGADVNKEMQTTTAKQSGSDGNYGQEHQHLQQVASAIPPSMGEYLAHPAQMELVGHSIACTPYPYSDPYYGGIMTAYGPQALVHPHLLGMHHTRMPLPLEMAEEPVYVNAKQYHGILRRRQSRAKAELEKKLIRVRKPYLHESRHQHAVRRARGCGGRFLNTKKLDCNAANPTPEKAKGSGAAFSTQSASSSGSESELLLSDSTGNLDCSSRQQEVKGPLVQDMHEPHTYHDVDTNGNSNNCYQHHQGHLSSTYRSLSGERGEEGDCSGQQRGSIPVSRAPHRALTIQ